ncbi:MAG: hypothetical protein MRZ79_21480 [Bacteroidia bacterium]|nr:hypothetical protein [Bacteroidia bacterium]
MKVIQIFIWLGLLWPMLGAQLHGQQVLIDRGVNVEGLWVFPLLSDPNTYLYLPYESKLSTDEQGNPKFSLLRYVINEPGEGQASETITEADGGAVLHFLIEYGTPKELVETAQSSLRERMENDSIKVRGPVIFEKGRYTLVSSIIKNKQKEMEVLATGEAPVLEGSKIALSFELTPQKSKLLLESLKMKTSDLSIVFDMAFSGLTDSYKAMLEVDWSEIQQSQAFKAGGSVYFVGADVELGFERLRKDNAIKLTTVGDGGNLDALVQTVYDKLLKMLFEPVKPESVPEDQQGGLMDAIGTAIGGALGNSRNTTGFGLNVGYQMKDFKTEGKSIMHFNGRSTVQRHHFITFNAGNLYTKYGKNKAVFQDVPLYDLAFQQREIYVGVDGDLEKEFESMLNSVTVSLRKKHQNGKESLRQMILTRESFQEYDGKMSMVYGSYEDSNRTEWLNYEFQTIWQFQGGGSMSSSWEKGNASMINLYTPFERKLIEVDGDLESLKAKDVRAIVLNIEYPFFDERKKKRVTIRPGDELGDKGIEITLPNEVDEVSYSLLWIQKDGKRVEKKGTDKYGLIFIDEMPEP